MTPEENARNNMLFEIKIHQFIHAMHRHQYSLMALALGFALNAWLWAGTAAPAQRYTPAPAPRPTEAERALALFEAKADQFQHFLSQRPTFLLKQSFNSSPTGVTFSHIQVILQTLSFDVTRSDSLVSPFLGTIHLTYEQRTNESCGDLPSPLELMGKRHNYGYSTYDKVMAHANPADSCFRPSEYNPINEAYVNFAFQGGRWVYKDVLDVRRTPHFSLSAAFGQPIRTGLRAEDNKAWEELVSR